MNRCSYIDVKGDEPMTGLEQTTPTVPENEQTPVEMPDDEVLYELADLFRVFGDSTTASCACRTLQTLCS